MSDLVPAGIGSLVQTAGTALQIDSSGADWLGAAWQLQLQPGSWRGIPFVMDSAEIKAGRRVAVHEYPYRDTVWPEDLGKLPQRFAFQAFYVGDDCYSIQNQMIAACEQAGSGTLVHPTYGNVTVVCVDFSTTVRRERGRMVEFQFSFVLAGDVLFPSSAVATQQNVQDCADALAPASASDLAAIVDPMPVMPAAVMTSFSGFTAGAVGAVNDATRALSAVSGLVGNYGRFATGNRTTLLPASATVASCLSAAVTSRSAVLSAASAVQTAIGGL